MAATSGNQADERREQIVAAARDLYEERGIAGTSVKDIADAVGVSRSLFYHYFPNKDAVTDAVLDTYIAELREMVEIWNASRRFGDVRGSLRESIRMLRRGVFNQGPFRADLAQRENASLYLRFTARTADVIARYITDTTAVDYAKHHTIEIDHIYETFFMLILGLTGYVRSHPEVPDETLEALAAQTLRLDLGEPEPDDAERPGRAD